MRAPARGSAAVRVRPRESNNRRRPRDRPLPSPRQAAGPRAAVCARVPPWRRLRQRTRHRAEQHRRNVEMTRRCRHSWRRATRAPAHRTPRTAASPRPARRTAGRTGHASRTHEGQDRGEATVRSAATTAACTVGRMVFASSLLRVTLLYTARPELVEGRAANRLMVRPAHHERALVFASSLLCATLLYTA